MIRDLINTGTNLNGAGGVSRETPVYWLPLHQIQDNPYQPRQHYDAEHILNLALSIKQLKGELPATRGLQQLPLARLGLVRPDGSFDAAARAHYSEPLGLRKLAGQYDAVAQLMFGHSRLRAFRVLCSGLLIFDPTTLVNAFAGGPQVSPRELGIDIDLTTVADWQTRYAELMEADPDYNQFPVTLGFALDFDMWRHAITENSQRKNINPIEEAAAMARAQAEFGLTDEEAGRPFGYARSTTANKMRLLKLPAAVQRDIAAGKLSERHGRELLRLADDDDRLKKAYDYAVKKGQTVAQLTESVNWEAKALKDAQEKQREIDIAREILAAGWTPPGSSTPLPENRFDEKWPSFFDDSDDKQLLKNGLCGSHCECCVLAYKSYYPEGLVRPDPERALHIGLACAGDFETRKAKQEALVALKRAGQVEVSEVERLAAEARAQRKARVEEIERQAREKWDAALAKVNRAGLWRDIRFWRLYLESANSGYRTKEAAKESRSVEDLLAAFLYHLLDHAKKWDEELRQNVPDMAAIDAMISQLTGESVSQETVEEAQP